MGRYAAARAGGLAVDTQGRIIGILNARATNLEHTVTIIPVHCLCGVPQPHTTLSEHATVPQRSAVIPRPLPDNYPEWMPPAPSGHLEHRPVEPS